MQQPAIATLPLGSDPEGYPVLPAYTCGQQSVVWCAYCGRWHRHGLGDGHRVAHCDSRTWGYARGYILSTVGTLTPAQMQREARRQHRDVATSGKEGWCFVCGGAQAPRRLPVRMNLILAAHDGSCVETIWAARVVYDRSPRGRVRSRGELVHVLRRRRIHSQLTQALQQRAPSSQRHGNGR